MKYTLDELYDMVEKLKEEITIEELLDAFVQAMGYDELLENIEYIARMYDVNLESEEDEE